MDQTPALYRELCQVLQQRKTILNPRTTPYYRTRDPLREPSVTISERNNYIKQKQERNSSVSYAAEQLNWTHDLTLCYYLTPKYPCFRFLRSESDDQDLTWEKRIAKKYYDRLFKEYALVELKYYKEGRVAMRWRNEKEVVRGKGMPIYHVCE